jgi:hypothetical protein
MAETQPVEAPKKVMKRQLSNESCLSYVSCQSKATNEEGEGEKINLQLEDRIQEEENEREPSEVVLQVQTKFKGEN